MKKVLLILVSMALGAGVFAACRASADQSGPGRYFGSVGPTKINWFEIGGHLCVVATNEWGSTNSSPALWCSDK